LPEISASRTLEFEDVGAPARQLLQIRKRTASQRPQWISVVPGAAAGSTGLIDRLPHASHTILSPDRCPL
jgi:hypothetical protein